ncbi:MAG TPA: PAS domain S-box protein [Deltaproteobacteria bacterium]|jgi:PAS domain S-box-containing protein|nr:PAS domain S-box protein [Deltaproteobacteria bacterium]HOI07567.1 PAS domain S-box protein [Deltaproteobacteria bacterium]
MKVYWLGRHMPEGLSGVTQVDDLREIPGNSLVFVDDKGFIEWQAVKGQRVYIVSDLPISRPLPDQVVGVIPRDLMVIEAIITLFTEMREAYDIGDRLIRSLNEKELAVLEKQKTLLRDSRRYQSIIKNATDLIFTLGPNGRIMFSNETMKRYLQTGEALAGKPLRDFVVEDDLKAMNGAVEQGFGKGTPSKVEVRLRLARGTTGIFSFMITPLVEDGHIYALSVIGRDITDLRSMQHRLSLQARDLTLMMNGLAHELRNPLMVIGAYMRRIEKKEKAMSSESLHAALSGINASVERIEEMIERIEQYEATVKLRVDYGEVDIRRIVTDVLEEMPGLMDASVAGERELVAFSDGNHIRTAFRRVMENALDTGSDRLEISLLRRDGYALASVRDFGPGVTVDTNEIFAPFYSSDPMKIGLGLTEARIAMAKIGSLIEVIPQADPGAVFTLKILMDRRNVLRKD